LCQFRHTKLQTAQAKMNSAVLSPVMSALKCVSWQMYACSCCLGDCVHVHSREQECAQGHCSPL
jgi:hypothetical protein